MNGRSILVVLGSAAFVGGCGDGLLGTSPEQSTLPLISVGENVVVVGAGLGTQPAVLDVTVPVSSSADILSAKLRWVGRGMSSTGDGYLLVNGHQRPAVLLASYDAGGDLPWVFFYEYDVTSLMRPGSNRLSVGGFDLPGTSREDGVGLVVRYRDPGSPWSAILTLDPNEFVSDGSGAVWSYPIGASADPRNARWILFAGDGTPAATDRLWLDVGRGPVPSSLVGSAPVVIDDALTAARGDRMDIVQRDLVVPARASHFAYQFESPAGVGDSILHFLGVLCIDGTSSTCSGEIGGRVWQDVDGDGLDGGEPGIAGVSVILRNAADDVLDMATTDADGAFDFAILCAGDYVVEVDDATLPEGYEPTSCTDGDCSPLALSLTADDEWVSDLGFGYAEPLPPPPPPTDLCCYPLRYWRHAFHRHGHDCRHHPEMDDPTLLALLPIVQASSGMDWTRGDGVLGFDDVAFWLRGHEHGRDRKMGHDRCREARSQYLASLLNYALNGAPSDAMVDTDRDHEPDMAWSAMISDTESRLKDSDYRSCRQALRQSLSVNLMGHEDCP